MPVDHHQKSPEGAAKPDSSSRKQAETEMGLAVPQIVTTPPSSSLNAPLVKGTANAPVRNAAVLQMQSTYGNRGTRTLLQRQAAVQRETRRGAPVVVQRTPTFTVGPPKRPAIHHDHGHLDDGHGNIDESKREEATVSDYAALAWWEAKLNAAEVLRPDLIDGTAAYRHFLQGNGADRTFDYERFIANDASGQTVITSAIEDTKAAAIRQHDSVLAANPAANQSPYSFDLVSNAISVGGDSNYPYPDTENWHKAIGGHSIWLSAHVTVTLDTAAQTRAFVIEMTLHAEDMYNFNPGAEDIATGTPDSANGRFEITGLGHEYMNRATTTRTIEATAPMAPSSGPGGTPGWDSGAPRGPHRPDRDGRGTGRR